MSQFYRSSNAIIAPVLMKDLNLTPHDLGLLGGVFFYAFGLIQIPLGVFMDRVGPRLTMIVLNAVGVAGAVLFANANSLAFGVTGRLLLGVGMAANMMGPLKIFTKWFDRRRFATISGSMLSLAALGSLAASSPLAALVEAFGWRESFYILAGLNGLLTVCIVVIVRDSPHHGDPGAAEQSEPGWAVSLRSLFSSWSYWAMSASVFLRYGAFASIQALWAGPFLIGFVGLDPISAGNILLILNLGFILGAPSGGIVSDRILKSRRGAVTLAYSVAACTALGLAFHKGSGSLILLGAIFFLLGFSNAFNQISYAHIRELMPERISGSAMTAINFFLMTGAGMFTHLLGIILEDTSAAAGSYYRDAFLICFGAFVLAALFYVTVREPKSDTKGEEDHSAPRGPKTTPTSS
jgi:sugar phosphate permease